MNRLMGWVFASVLVFSQGCILGVGWLPDSSGFVFTTTRGDLVLYQFETNIQRVLLHNRAASTTCWPAVSPRGDRVALAQLENSGDQQQAQIQIEICDLDGKQIFRSEKFKFAQFEGVDLRYSTQLVWSPDQTQILVHGRGDANGGTGFSATALFNVATHELSIWQNFVPAYFAGSPVRPDGAGFLLIDTENDNRFTWFDWSGKRQPIADAKPEANSFSRDTLTQSAFFGSHWDGAKAILNVQQHQCVVDTDTLKLTVVSRPEAETRLGDEFIHQRVELASGVELLMLVNDATNPPGDAIRLVARADKTAPLIEVVAPLPDRMVLIDLSPDRQHAVLRVSYGYRGSKADSIFVIDDRGRLTDTIVIKEKGGPSDRFEVR